jgi:class 3 adenylate cyclase
MVIDSLSDLYSFVALCVDNAIEAAKEAGLRTIKESADYFSANASGTRYAKSIEPVSLMSQPDLQDRDVYYAQKAWGAVLSVDIRGSTNRALEIGAEKTFVTMHVYMQTMIRLVLAAKGIVVGLRGDGLLAAFGRKPFDVADPWLPDESLQAILEATSCGDAMQRATSQIINPILVTKSIPGDLRIGVGIEAGPMVITKIGLHDALDITAYGHCLNLAAKIGSDKKNRGLVLIGPKARGWFIGKPGGKIRVEPFATDMFKVTYPQELATIS